MSRPSPSSPTSSLPPELWLQVFSELTIRRFPMKDLDYKLLRCRNPFRICRKLHRSQPWLARSLLLVCKSWNAAVKPLLYDTIFLSKASQIKDLASMLRGQALPNPTHPNTSSWIKRLVVMISNPNDKVDSSDFGELMASCHNLTALHVVMHFPDASDHYPSSHVLFLNVLLTASTLQILNLVACVAPYKEDAIPSYFFKHMTALRAFRCDNNIVIPDIPPLDYLSVREWTVEDLLERDQTSVAIGEIFLQRVSLFPISLPKTKHLHRLNIHFSYALSIGNDDEEEEEARPEVDNSGLDLEDVPSPGEIPAASLEVDSIGSDSDAGGDGGGGHSHLGFSDSEDLQGAVDVLPPTVTYLSLLCGRWEHAVCRRLRRLPASVTTLGLEASREHATDTSYRHLVRMCRDLIAPGLTVVQLNHWQTCVDLRTRHPGLLKEFVEMLGNRNAELWDSEGYVMEGTVS